MERQPSVFDLRQEGAEPSTFVYFPLSGAQIGLATVCLSLCVISIAMRTYTRVRIMKTFDLSDASLILSGVFLAAFIAAKLVANTYGQGHHLTEKDAANISKVLVAANLVEVFYTPPMFFAKFAVLKQIETIFFNHRHEKLAFKAIWTLIWANLAFYAAIMFAFIFACVPRAKIGDPTLPGKCIDTLASIVATSAINVVSDVTILIIPLVAVWELQMKLKVKLGAAAVFAIGIFGCITSIIRLYYTVLLVKSDDLLKDVEPVGSWALGECTSVVLVACFPVFPRLFNHFVKKPKGSSYQLSDNTRRGIKSNKSGSQHKTPIDPFEVDERGSTTALRGTQKGFE